MSSETKSVLKNVKQNKKCEGMKRFEKKQRAKELEMKQAARINESFRQKEREAKQASWENYIYRQQELARDALSKRGKRNIDFYREHERMSKRQKRLDGRCSHAERFPTHMQNQRNVKIQPKGFMNK